MSTYNVARDSCVRSISCFMRSIRSALSIWRSIEFASEEGVLQMGFGCRIAAWACLIMDFSFTGYDDWDICPGRRGPASAVSEESSGRNCSSEQAIFVDTCLPLSDKACQRLVGSKSEHDRNHFFQFL